MRNVLVMGAAALIACAPEQTEPDSTFAPSASRGAGGRDREPTLLARAILPSDAYQPGPESGVFIGPNNGVVPPFPGQPIPGFSDRKSVV